MKKHADKFDLRNDWDNIKDRILDTRDAFTDAAYDVKGKAGYMLKRSAKNVKVKSAEARKNIHNRIKLKPMQSLGLAMIAGAIISRIVLRK